MNQLRFDIEVNKIYLGDALQVLRAFPPECVDMVMTSPPYWLQRDYKVSGQIGLEPDIGAYLGKLKAVFAEVKRVLKKTGTCWVNIADKYQNKGHRSNTEDCHAEFRSVKYSISNRVPCPAYSRGGFPQKAMMQIPERFTLMMTDELGFIRRSGPIWEKTNCKPESVYSRFVYNYEHIYFYVKTQKYYFETQYEPAADSSARDSRVRQQEWSVKRPDKGYPRHPSQGSGFIKSRRPGYRIMRSIWRIATNTSKKKHSATYPDKLCVTPILAGCPRGGVVLDPFSGTGTTCRVARQLDRDYIGIELNPEYANETI